MSKLDFDPYKNKGVSKKAEAAIRKLRKDAGLGNHRQVKIAISAGVDLSSVDENKHTALHIAAKAGHAECVEALAKAGVDKNAVGSWGETAAVLAALKGSAQVLDALARHGADMNLGDEDGDTPAQFAAAGGAADCLAVLIKHGADVDSTAAIYAAANGNKDCLDLLLANIALDEAGLVLRELEAMAREKALKGVAGCWECVELIVSRRERAELDRELARVESRRGLRI